MYGGVAVRCTTTRGSKPNVKKSFVHIKNIIIIEEILAG